MDSERIRSVLGVSACALVVYASVNVALERTARWVELEHDGYLWQSEEWLQLLEPQNFVDRGEGRILFTGSSEGREGFLVDELRAGLPGFDIYNNSYSNHSLGTLLLVLSYIEVEYGPTAMPDKLVIGATPWFMLNDPTVQISFFPGVINRYTPRWRMDVQSEPPALVRKNLRSSVASRFRYLQHQSRRYRRGLRGAALALLPEVGARYDLRRRLIPGRYYDLPPFSLQNQLELIRNLPQPRSTADPSRRLEALRQEYAALMTFVDRHDIDLFVVDMPLSTVMTEEYFEGTYGAYQEALRDVVGDTPLLDLAGFLSDDQFYDLLHANLEGARLLSRRVARFLREEDGGPGPVGAGSSLRGSG